MKMEHYLKVMTLFVFGTLALASSAQQSRPLQKGKTLEESYRSIRNPEISLDHFLKIHKQHNLLNRANFDACSKLNDACANGDFESGLDLNEWQGAYGFWYGGDPDPLLLADGLVSGDIFSADAHQTIVSSGVDYFTPISTVPPGGGKQALRIGNAANSNGLELLSKTIKVTSSNSNFKFSYAVVFEDPGHTYYEQPAFSVRVYDCATGEELNNVCNLGNGSNKIVSDASNPFFQSQEYGYQLIAYRDWTSSFVDLSKYIGRTVSIQFINNDCAMGGHFGYTYIDQVCGNIDIGYSGGVLLDAAKTDSCGSGEICTNVYLGKTADGSVTGTAVLHLNVYQNGNLLTTINSETITVDSSRYCFSINPATLGLDESLKGFDYVITNSYSLSGYEYVNPFVGSVPDGIKSGTNNDYLISCDSVGQTQVICLRDGYGYEWKLKYKTDGNVSTATGTVDVSGIPWNAYGSWNESNKKFELHAINPMGDNCASGYTDSFVYRGYAMNGRFGYAYFGGQGDWTSYCGPDALATGSWSIISCRYNGLPPFFQKGDGLKPAGAGIAISLKVSPNPVTHVANINYTLARKGNVNITIYNYMMQPVKTLVSASKAAGAYSVSWDGRGANGVQAPAGLYKVVATVNGKIYSETMQVVR